MQTIATGVGEIQMISKASQVAVNTVFGVGFLVLLGAVFVVNRMMEDQ